LVSEPLISGRSAGDAVVGVHHPDVLADEPHGSSATGVLVAAVLPTPTHRPLSTPFGEYWNSNACRCE